MTVVRRRAMRYGFCKRQSTAFTRCYTYFTMFTNGFTRCNTYCFVLIAL